MNKQLITITATSSLALFSARQSRPARVGDLGSGRGAEQQTVLSDEVNHV